MGGSEAQNIPLPEQEPTPEVVTVGVDLLQNALSILDLPASHINTNHIRLLASEQSLRKFFPHSDASGVTDPDTNQIFIAKSNGHERFSPALLIRLVDHEGGHFISLEFQPVSQQKIDKFRVKRQGDILEIRGTEFFKGYDEGAAEHFAEFAVAQGQDILAKYPKFKTARVSVSSRDGHLSKDYIHFYDFWNILKRSLAHKNNFSSDQAEKELLKSMANGGLQELFSDEEIILIGLYGVQLQRKGWFLTDKEPHDLREARDEQIASYFTSDEAARKFIAEKIFGSVKEFNPSLFEAAKALPEIMRALHPHTNSQENT